MLFLAVQVSAASFTLARLYNIYSANSKPDSFVNKKIEQNNTTNIIVTT